MAKFKFRLATLLRLREETRDQRRTMLAEAYLAEQKLNERRQAIAEEATLAKRTGALVGAIDIDRLMTANRYDLALKAELHVLDEQSKLLAPEIEKRRQALVAADREVRVLEKLRETQLERFRQEERDASMKQMDEVAGRLPLRENLVE
jgi:flagellar FliJ protein